MVKKKRQSDLHEGSSTESSEEMKTSSLAAENLCHHTKKAVDTNRLRKVLKPIGLQKTCSECDKNTTQTNGVGGEHGPDPSPDDEEVIYDNTLWLCMKCGSQMCGRAKNQHALNHFKVSFFLFTGGF